MAYEQKDLSGSLFKNDRKESDSHPDYKGSALIDGRKMWVSGWKKTSRNGEPYLSLSFKPVEAQTAQREPPRKPAVAGGAQLLDDDVPFAPEF